MSTVAAWWDEKVDGVPRIPVGEWIEDGFDWIEEHLGSFFDALSDFLKQTVISIADLLTELEPIAMAIVFALLAWLVRDWRLGIGTFLGMAFIISMEQWQNAMTTLAMIIAATVIALLIGIPLGILAARSERFSRVLRPIMDLMQTMPAFVWLVPVVTLFGVNEAAGLVSTVIFAVPPGVRLTELGIRQVDPEVVEAGHAFGATPRQILGEVQVPLAMPTIMAGINQVIMLALSMAVIAGLVGAKGLGGAVTEAIGTINIGLGFEAGLSVVVLAIFLDRVTAAAGNTSPGQGRFRELIARVGLGRRPQVAKETTTETATEDVPEAPPVRMG